MRIASNESPSEPPPRLVPDAAFLFGGERSTFEALLDAYEFTQPMVIFLHYSSRKGVEKLATGFKAVLDELGRASCLAHSGAH